MKLRVLVVDDEQPARRRLIDLIARRTDLELAGTSADGREAIEAILTRAPDLVLLDVQMPELTGLDVVRAIGAERMPPVIFVTAHDRYALRAFELAAVDYLMKPFDDARFDQAASRAHELIRLRTTDELRTQLLHLLVATDGKLAPHAPAQFIERIAVRERKEIRSPRSTTSRRAARTPRSTSPARRCSTASACSRSRRCSIRRGSAGSIARRSSTSLGSPRSSRSRPETPACGCAVAPCSA